MSFPIMQSDITPIKPYMSIDISNHSIIELSKSFSLVIKNPGLLKATLYFVPVLTPPHTFNTITSEEVKYFSFWHIAWPWPVD